MPTRLDDARIKLELDVGPAKAKLEAIEAEYAKLQDKQRGVEQKKETQKDEQEREVEEQAREIEERGRGFSENLKMPPIRALLSAAGLVGAIPVVGGAARVGVEALQKYGALGVGLIEGLTDEMPPLIRAALRAVTDTVEELHQQVNKHDATLRSIEPAMETVLALGKAQLLADSASGLSYLAEVFGQARSIEEARIRMQRFSRDMALRTMSETGGPALVNEVKKAFKNQQGK